MKDGIFGEQIHGEMLGPIVVADTCMMHNCTCWLKQQPANFGEFWTWAKKNEFVRFSC